MSQYRHNPGYAVMREKEYRKMDRLIMKALIETIQVNGLTIGPKLQAMIDQRQAIQNQYKEVIE